MKIFRTLAKTFAAVSCCLLLSHCAAPRTTIRTDDQSGSIVFKVKPSNAEVSIDGTVVGKARDFDGSAAVLKLAPGTHVVRLTAEGHKAWETRVYLSDSQELVEISLEKQEP